MAELLERENIFFVRPRVEREEGGRLADVQRLMEVDEIPNIRIQDWSPFGSGASRVGTTTAWTCPGSRSPR
jgi:hypothetical protein